MAAYAERSKRILAAMACAFLHALLAGSLVPGCAQAAEPRSVRLLVSDDNAFSRETATRLQEILERSIPGLVERDGASGDSPVVGQLLITVGSKAWKALMANPPREAPILAVIPNRALYEEMGESKPRNSAAIFLEQPLPRLFNLISLLKPNDAKVGIMLGKTNLGLSKELRSASETRKQELRLEAVDAEANAGRILASIIGDVNVLLAIPDPVTQTANTIQSILLMSYRAGIPVIGFSAAYQRAGAMVSLYTTPEQFARQAAEAVVAWRDGKSLPASQAPKYFTVDINQTVARSLGIRLPGADAMEQKLRTMRE